MIILKKNKIPTKIFITEAHSSTTFISNLPNSQ